MVPKHLPLTPPEIELLLDAAGYNQEEAARLLGVEQGTISKWRSGQLSPGPQSQAKLRKVQPLPGRRREWATYIAEAQVREAAFLASTKQGPVASGVTVGHPAPDGQSREAAPGGLAGQPNPDELAGKVAKAVTATLPSVSGLARVASMRIAATVRRLATGLVVQMATIQQTLGQMTALLGLLKTESGQVAALLARIDERLGQAPPRPQVPPVADALALPSPTAQMVNLTQAFAAKLAEEATRVVGAARQEAEWLTTAARLALREALWNRARRILREAHHRARNIVEEAQRTAQCLVEEAQRTAQGILQDARRDAERINHQARWEVRRRYLLAVALILGILGIYNVPWTRLIASVGGGTMATNLGLPAPATPTGARSRVGRPVPKEPLKGQMRAPCGPFTTINGGCWLGGTDDNHNALRAPCPEEMFESAGYCFVPMGERGERLPSTVDP